MYSCDVKTEFLAPLLSMMITVVLLHIFVETMIQNHSTFLVKKERKRLLFSKETLNWSKVSVKTCIMLQKIISDKFRSLKFLTLIMINILITKQKLQLIETEQQISVSRFLKDHVTLKTGEMMLKIWKNFFFNYKIFLNVHMYVYT